MTESNQPRPLGGWLILVGIGVIVSPFWLLSELLPSYKAVFEDGTWEALTNKGSDYYIAYFDILLIGEMTFNAIMLLASFCLAYMYFKKNYFFPKLYIVILLVTLIFIPLDAWLVSLVLPDEPIFDPDTMKEFTKSLIASAIWIPYMLISVRVKETFIVGTRNRIETEESTA